MAEKFRSYGAARTIFSIWEFIAFGIAMLGCLVCLGGFRIGAPIIREMGIQPSFLASFIIIVFGLSIVIWGIFGIALAQFLRAGVDTAEYTQQHLSIARSQLEVSRQMQTGKPVLPTGFSAPHETTQKVVGFPSTKRAEPGLSPTAPELPNPPKINDSTLLSYRDTDFRLQRDGTYELDDRPFASVELVTQYIDEKLK